MVKKIVSGLIFACVIIGISLTIGCSKREQVLAATAVLSGATGTASFLKGHFKRNDKRKHKMTGLRYHSIQLMK